MYAKKETESKNTRAKCLSCLGNIRESSEGRISGVLLGEVRKKACKLNWSNFVYALLARIRTSNFILWARILSSLKIFKLRELNTGVCVLK